MKEDVVDFLFDKNILYALNEFMQLMIELKPSPV